MCPLQNPRSAYYINGICEPNKRYTLNYLKTSDEMDPRPFIVRFFQFYLPRFRNFVTHD